ncbi:ComEC/Rec2 family competence protein [Rhizobium ruizarguesonis]|uniref:hypothetical protein n=1 Tax=Rhizobium ruizarguesonis TaxID=2081791 RepID=UPI0010309DBF|nr:hypothetical protein [Rhizobium ruizarguesonis]TBE14545.1 hypothetical protein ELH07_38205 [Rhizobium ruizarguesonis]
MYRQGLGDCFLISLARTARQEPYKIMIDCGVILGTSDAAVKMTKVVDDITADTKGRVDVLVVTHQHWDHVSGFLQADTAFDRLKFDQVWFAWTEDPDNELAKRLQQEQSDAISQLRLGASAMRIIGKSDQAADIETLLGFFGAAGGTTKDAMKKAALKGKVRYCDPKDPPLELADPAVKIYVLGPPQDEKALHKTLASASSPETYGLAAYGLAESAADALGPCDDSAPFGAMNAIPYSSARALDFFEANYFGPGNDAPLWRQIETSWLDSSTELALALDSYTNNTSLVLAIEFPDGDVLLFVADAQVGNWLSWQQVSWEVQGRTVKAQDLVSRSIFYKVGHHGSSNATLKKLGIEAMDRLEFAMVPVDHDMAVRKRWGKLPFDAIVAALETKGVTVLRSDQTPTSVGKDVTITDLYMEINL